MLPLQFSKMTSRCLSSWVKYGLDEKFNLPITSLSLDKKYSGPKLVLIILVFIALPVFYPSSHGIPFFFIISSCFILLDAWMDTFPLVSVICNVIQCIVFAQSQPWLSCFVSESQSSFNFLLLSYAQCLVVDSVNEHFYKYE